MNRTLLSLVAFALLATALSGCLGDDDGGVSGAIPVAKATVTPVAGKADTFLFDASGSSGRGLKYEWSFGDQQTANEARVEHTYEYGSGVYTARLVITDAAEVTDLWEGTVTVGSGENMPPVAQFTLSARSVGIGLPLTVDARESSDIDGDPLVYKWDFNHLPMSEEQYIEFREAKKDATPTAITPEGEVSEGGGTGQNAAWSAPELPTVPPLDLGDKDLGHDGGGHGQSAALIRRESTEPVYVLEEGLPEAAVYYVKLTVLDVKGGTQKVVSEEIWPVLVTETPEQAIFTDSRSGTFTYGAPDVLTDATPDDQEPFNEHVNDQQTETFTIPKPVEEMWLNVTWNQPDTVPVANDVDMFVKAPSGGTRHANGTDDFEDGIHMFLTLDDNLGTGKWEVTLYGRSGIDIQWTLNYWVKADMNPFRDIEAPYVE